LRHIRQTEERYEHLLDTANDAILVLDAETKLIVQANRQSSKLLRRPLREIGGIRGEELVLERDRTEYDGILDSTFRGTAVAGKEPRLSHSGGHAIAVEVNTSLEGLQASGIGCVKSETEGRRRPGISLE
jgi:PAS domain S-box-containing protein